MPLRITNASQVASLNKWADSVDLRLSNHLATLQKHDKKFVEVAAAQTVFQTNGVTNVVQDKLNIVAGTGMTAIAGTDGSVTLNAISSGGGGSIPAEYMLSAGKFDFVGMAVASDVHLTDSALRVYAARFHSPYSLAFTKMAFVGSNNLLGGGDVAAAIYSASGAKLWTSPTVHVPNSNHVTYTTPLTGMSLPPAADGYYLAWTGTDAGNTTVWGFIQTTYTLSSAGNFPLVNLNKVMFGYSANLATEAGGVGGTIAFPSSLGSLTAITDPNVGFPGFMFNT